MSEDALHPFPIKSILKGYQAKQQTQNNNK